jgi:hypothetical protein
MRENQGHRPSPYGDDSEEEEDEEDDDEEVPPPPPPKASAPSAIPKAQPQPQQQPSSSSSSSSDRAPESSSAKALSRLAELSLSETREEEEGATAPVASKGPAVTHERLYSQSKSLYYYVDMASGTSSWHPPAKGCVLCSDDQGRQYSYDVETGSSTWIKYY